MVERLLERLRVDFGARRGPSPPRSSRLEFVSEQTGEVETGLKTIWSEFFRSRADVATAYLACVRFHGEANTSVALCLRASSSDRSTLIAFVSDVFQQMFDPDECLSLVFLSEEQERQIRTIAWPFYDARHESPMAQRPSELSSSHATQSLCMDTAPGLDRAVDGAGDGASLRLFC